MNLPYPLGRRLRRGGRALAARAAPALHLPRAAHLGAPWPPSLRRRRRRRRRGRRRLFAVVVVVVA
eukprot:1330880-Pyramimonas_sp.AAC.1